MRADRSSTSVHALFGASTFLAVAAFAMAGCASEATSTDGTDGDEVGDPPSATNASELVDSTTDGCASLCTPQNCVIYARCRTNNDNVAGSLPYGLTTWSDKKARVNSSSGHHGCVAMINTGSAYGHAAYVEDSWLSSGARLYRLSEASWTYSYSCDNRSGTKGGLNIYGFWCP